MKLQDCYREYGDVRTFLSWLYYEWVDGIDDITFYNYLTEFLVDNGYEISKYEIDERDDPITKQDLRELEMKQTG